ncbi:MAG: transporter [Metallibacterium scheffleri]|uniref:transporter n=1 Tax=Metallibacterium scheffleri TaxID=993689 RepID=UPI0026EDF2CB|nr:transporter [Metallibacterium scheffleri]MCK9367282.1 transporter [Metallibacterium scheffleri]
MRKIKTGALLALVAVTLAASASVAAQQTQQAGGTAAAENTQDMQAITREMQALKSRYADEVRKLRELEIRLQALTARVQAQEGVARVQAIQQGSKPAASTGVADVGVAAGAAQAATAATSSSETLVSSEGSTRQEPTSRSVEDVLQQQHVLFNQPLTLEVGLNYARYDRKQLTLNGFLALDAIFLGSIAIEDVASDTFTYTFAARKGITRDLSASIEVPMVQRWTTYQKGGAGGSAAAVAEAGVGGDVAIGDVTAGASYRLFPETTARPEIALNASVGMPTGQAPYGIPWTVLERDNDDFIRFAVPTKQPTGQGVWSINFGASMLKTLDPAILFANASVTHTFKKHFSDLDNSPDTVSPGKVDLGNALNYGIGVAFALNERMSLSMSFSERLNSSARIRPDATGVWQGIIGSSGNAATFGIGMTYALSESMTFVGNLGIGLTPDAPDFSITAKLPFTL